MPFGPSQFVGDLVGGFRTGADSIRQTNERDAALQAERDNKLFDALANSDDPDIRAAAVTGLITGNHPARALDKFFGKVGQHPAYEQIKGLVQNGHAPFPGATEQEVRSTAAKTTGVFRGAEQAKIPLSDQDKTDVFRSMHGAARRSVNRVPIIMTHEDGSEEAGSFDPSDGSYWDQNESQVWDVKGYRRATPNPTAAGGRNVTGNSALTPEQFRAQYPEFASSVASAQSGDVVSFRLGPDNKPSMITVSNKPPGAAEPVPNIYPGPQGPVGIGRGGREVQLPPSIRGTGRAASPTEHLTALRGIMAGILQLVPNPKGLAGLPPSAREVAATRGARDAEAVKHGFKDFTDLEGQIGAAGGDVGSATPPPPTVGASPPPAGGPPRVAPPPGPQGKKKPASRDPVVDAILQQLGR